MNEELRNVFESTVKDKTMLLTFSTGEYVVRSLERLWRSWERAAEIERARCIKIIEAYQVPVGNSPAGEMAADWTMQALRDIRDEISGSLDPS